MDIERIPKPFTLMIILTSTDCIPFEVDKITTVNPNLRRKNSRGEGKWLTFS
jgi:hypothetical protein